VSDSGEAQAPGKGMAYPVAPAPQQQAFSAAHPARRSPADRGYARAAALTPERRREIAQTAARSRWGTAGVVEIVVAATHGTCRKGHPYSVVATTGREICRTCRIESGRKWRLANPGYFARYRAEHRAHLREVMRAWRERNRENVRGYHREYQRRWRASRKAAGA
jgi:hypothetical protein